MPEIAETTTIARPPGDVWAVLADFGAISRWAPNVDHSCLITEQADQIGAVRRVQVGRAALLERVVEWSPGERLSYTIHGLPPVIREATNTWTLAESDASTIVTVTSRIDAGPRPPQQLIARLANKGLARASRQMLAGLTSHVQEVAA